MSDSVTERGDRDARALSAMLADPRGALHVSTVLLATTIVCLLLMWWRDARLVVQSFDDAFLDGMVGIRNTPLTWLAKSLSFLGGTWCTWSIRAVVVAVLMRRRHWVHLGAFAAAVVTSELLIGVLKAMYDRPRPGMSLVETSGASLPSGHAVAAAVTAVGLVIVLFPAGHKRWVWERQAAIYASLMALSRTYLGAHWFSDVVVGSLLGSTIAIGWPALFVYASVRVSRRAVRE